MTNHLAIFGTDKKWNTDMNEMAITKKMLEKLREGKVNQAKRASEVFTNETVEKDNFLTRSKVLMEEAVESKKKVLKEGEQEENDHKDYFEIKKDTPQFGDVRTSQEDSVKKTINDNVQFEPSALRYYPKANDMTLDGKIQSLNLTFQFRYNDPSGDGVYIWTDAMQLTETNARTIGKVRDAFSNWKDSITQDGDLMEKLKKASENKD